MGTSSNPLRDFYESQYARGLAVGQSYITDGTITFRHRKNTFTFNAEDVIAQTEYNGSFYVAPVKALKALQRKLKVKGERDG